MKENNDQKTKLTRLEVRQMYSGLESPKLEGIKNFALFYAIDRTRRKLKPVAEALSPEKMIPDLDKYNTAVRNLHETLSGGKTIENPVTGEKMWDINYSSNEYVSKITDLKKEHGIDKYDEFIKGEFEENIEDYIHFVNEKEVDRKKDVPDYGTWKLIHFLFKETD